MVEQLRTPERHKKGAPINIVYGSHDDDSTCQLNHLDNVIKQYLQNTTGNIVVFIEDADAPISIAEQIERRVKSGFRPSDSIKITTFSEKYHRLPSLSDQFDLQSLSTILARASKFAQKEIKILDEHFESGRIQLLWEARPDEEIKLAKSKGIYPVNTYAKTKITESDFAVFNGNFDQAIIHFKKSVDIVSHESNRRERLLASRISTSSQDYKVSGVVGFIGATHTRLGHILSKNGHEVSTTFAEKEDGNLIYSIHDEAVRQKQFFQNSKIPHDRLYRLMIANTIQTIYYNLFEENEKIKGQIVNEQRSLSIARSTLQRLQLTNMKQILQFEKGVQQNGFIEEINRRLGE